MNVWLDYDTVSRRHACIAVKGSAVWLQDLASKNGTRIGGRPVRGKVTLNDGDAIQFGQVSATWRAQSSLSATRSQIGSALPLSSSR